MLITTFSYCCYRYIFKHLSIGCLYWSGAFLCKINDYQVSFVKVFLMALDFYGEQTVITMRTSLDISCADLAVVIKVGLLSSAFMCRRWSLWRSKLYLILCTGDRDRPVIRGTQGCLLPHQVAQSPVQPDVLSHTKGPDGFVQQGYESLSSRQVIPSH